MTGFAQVAFPHQADRQPDQGRRQGRRLQARGAGSSRRRSTSTSARPATAPAYNAAGDDVREPRADEPRSWRRTCTRSGQAILKLEGPYNPGLTIHDIPVDAVTTSGSGHRPRHLAGLRALQARRVAAVRHLPLATVQQLISQNTDGRSWGFLGEPGVNVLELNVALDKLGGVMARQSASIFSPRARRSRPSGTRSRSSTRGSS